MPPGPEPGWWWPILKNAEGNPKNIFFQVLYLLHLHHSLVMSHNLRGWGTQFCDPRRQGVAKHPFLWDRGGGRVSFLGEICITSFMKGTLCF